MYFLLLFAPFLIPPLTLGEREHITKHEEKPLDFQKLKLLNLKRQGFYSERN